MANMAGIAGIKRPLCVIGPGFALAVRAAFALVGNAPGETLLLSLAACLTGVLLMALPTLPRVKPAVVQGAALAALAAAAGLGAGWLYAQRNIAPFGALAGETVEIRGIVEETAYYPGSARYTLKADFPGEPGLPSRQRVTLRVYGEAEFLPGDMLQGEIRVITAGFGGSSYDLYGGIRGTGYGTGGLERAELAQYRWDQRLVRFRGWLKKNLYSALPADVADLAAGLALGQRGEVPSQVRLELSRSGAAHLLAVSGLHLSVFSWFVLELLGALRIPRIPRILGTVLACFAFAAVVGFSASILRAFLMLSVMYLADLAGRRSDSINNLGLALLVICIIWPHWTLGQGIWLSFSATLGIILVGGPLGQRMASRYRGIRPGADRLARALLRVAGVSIGAYLFTLPLLLASNGWISLVAPLTNVAISPFVAAALLGSIACALLGGGFFLIRPVAWVTRVCVGAILEIARVMSGLPFATAALDELWQLLWLGLAVAAGGVLLLRRDRRLASWGVALCVLVYGAGELTDLAGKRGGVELAVLEGCGSAVLLREGQAVVVGAPSQYDVGVLLNYLRFRGVDRVSALIAPDCGEQINSGVLRLREELGLDCVIGPNDDYIVDQLARALPGVPVYPCGYALVEVLGGVEVSFPLPGDGVWMEIGPATVLKYGGEYAIIEQSGRHPGEAPRIYTEGLALWGPGAPLPEPVGGRLYGETRFYLSM